MSTFNVRFKDRKTTKRILIHDSHTEPSIERAADYLKINGLKMGLIQTGYHFIIERDGMVVNSRPLEQIGAAAPGFDLDSVHICLVGGRTLLPHVQEPGDAKYTLDASVPDDNFTAEQREALFITIQLVKQQYPEAALFGHDEVQRFKRPGAKCPCLDMHDLRADYHTFIQTNGMVF